jgi:hypothetical protein
LDQEQSTVPCSSTFFRPGAAGSRVGGETARKSSIPDPFIYRTEESQSLPPLTLNADCLIPPFLSLDESKSPSQAAGTETDYSPRPEDYSEAGSLRNSNNPPAADGEVIITTRRRRRRWKEDMAEAATGGRLLPVEDSLWVREDLLSPGEDKKGGLNIEPDSRTVVLFEFESGRRVSDTSDNANDFDDGDLQEKKVIVADEKSEDSSCPVMEKLPTENGDGDIGDIFHLDLYPEPGPSRDFIREVGVVGVHRSSDLRMGKDIRYILTRLGYAESFMIDHFCLNEPNLLIRTARCSAFKEVMDICNA